MQRSSPRSVVSSRVIRLSARALAASAVAVAVACGGPSGSGRDDPRPAAGAAPATSVASGAVAAARPVDARPRVVFLGDSLTAGYGLDPGLSFPDVVQQRIDAAGLDYAVVNMGVSGDTSAGGRRRLDWALYGDVKVLVVALGGNDGLRGLAPSELRANLAAIIDAARARRIDVLLCGMEAPPNFGGEYTREFREVYPSLARDKQVALLPFLLEGVAGDPALNQPDGIHPSAEGATRVADLVWTSLRPLLNTSHGTR